jgi:DinB superfamily
MTDRSALVTEARHELARFPALLDAVVAGLTPTRWRARPAPDEWAAVEIVCHLRDEEAEDFGARIRLLLDGGTRFAAIDPQGWPTARRYHGADPSDALAEFHQRRAESLAMLAGATAERLAASGESPSGLRLSGLDLLCAWVTHDGLHLRQLAGTLTREWADRWAPLRADYAGPIPYSRDGALADP